jgi:hypothetical protein
MADPLRRANVYEAVVSLVIAAGWVLSSRS